MTTSKLLINRIINSRWFSSLNMPLYRNGLALVISMVATSGLGLLYWALAAWNYSPSVVGVNSAIISAMMFLSHIAQFGLANFLTRFLPKAGRQTTRLIVISYLSSTSIGLIASLIFVMGLKIWSPSLISLQENPLIFASFVFATMLWCIFALQDGVMVGLRQSVWVPVENVIFALVKIGLLLLFAKIFVQYGIFASWALPIIFISLAVNFIVFTMFIPAHEKETEANAEHFSISDMIRFVGGDYFSTLVWTATTDLMPLLIIEKAGSDANAYFYLAWTIAYSLYLVSRNFGMSLTVEAVKDPSRLAEYGRDSLVHTATLLIPIVLVIMIGADWLLLIFGKNYAEYGAGLLRLLALSALPNAIISLYTSIARVERKVLNIAIVLTSQCVLAIILTLTWLEQFGLVGVGMAWLTSQTAVAGILLLTKFRPILFGARKEISQ